MKLHRDEDQIGVIHDTKWSFNDAEFRPAELAKIESTKKHAMFIGINNYYRSALGNWNLK